MVAGRQRTVGSRGNSTDRGPAGDAPAEALDEQVVLEEAIRTFDALPQIGHRLAQLPAPAEYPFSAAVRHVAAIRWRSVNGILGCQAVAYELPSRLGSRATLYVVSAMGLDGLDTVPALHPFTTGGRCASAWQENGLLYVLVVQGDTAAYTSYLNPLREPVA